MAITPEDTKILEYLNEANAGVLLTVNDDTVGAVARGVTLEFLPAIAEAFAKMLGHALSNHAEHLATVAQVMGIIANDTRKLQELVQPPDIAEEAVLLLDKMVAMTTPFVALNKESDNEAPDDGPVDSDNAAPTTGDGADRDDGCSV